MLPEEKPSTRTYYRTFRRSVGEYVPNENASVFQINLLQLLFFGFPVGGKNTQLQKD